jgi:sodium/potassium-transporting ATPase subunit alpha
MNTVSDSIVEAEATVEPDETNQRLGRIQYAEDVETGTRRGRVPRRQSSDSLSIRSMSRRRSIDPATLIPTEYRTVYGSNVLTLFNY